MLIQLSVHSAGQVSSSLPKTSYFKMVDVWFLFCIGLTFLVISFHAVVDYVINTEEEKTPVLRPGWVGPNVSKGTVKDQLKVNQRVMTSTKVLVLVSFAVFNLGYWGYIFW